MNLLDIVNKLKNNEITIVNFGHTTNDIIDDIENYYDWQKECADKDNDIGIRILNKQYNKGDNIFSYLSSQSIYCFDCGEYLNPIFIDENTIYLVTQSLYREKYKNTDLDFSVKENIPMCSMYEHIQKGFLSTEIDVPSGNLLFVNYFNNDKIYDMPDNIRYKNENSLNCIKGRYNHMKYFETMNIGYGQMGNTSITIFLKNDGTEILIGDDYFYSEELGEREIKHIGYKNIGEISLSVWRWMCADIDILKQNNYNISEELQSKIDKTKQSKKAKYSEDEILAKVKKGKWIIEHYYDINKQDDIIYSKLYLKK